MRAVDVQGASLAEWLEMARAATGVTLAVDFEAGSVAAVAAAAAVVQTAAACRAKAG